MAVNEPLDHEEVRGLTKGFVIAWALITASLVSTIAFGAAVIVSDDRGDQRQNSARIERSKAVNEYLRLDCRKDSHVIAVLVGILDSSAARVRDPERARYFRSQSSELLRLSQECESEIPPPIEEDD